MAYVRLPNDSYFPIAEGETPEQALQAAQQKYPRAFLTEKELEERQGFTAATKDAFKRAKAGSYEAAGKLFGSDTLKQLADKEREELEEQPGFLPTTEGDREAAFKKGLFSGIGALGREYISEPIGGMVGRYGVPLAVGAGASLAAPAVGIGGFGAAVAGGAATALADYLPQVGENIERQRDVGQPEDIQSAALSGIPQAVLSGLNIRLGMLPKGIQNIFRADAAALQKQVAAGALKPEEAISKLSGNLKNILLSTGSAGVVGAGTMGAEEVLRRQQAGQSLTDEAAQEDYLQIAKDAATIAPLFGVPRGAFRRGAEKRGIERAGQEFTAAEGVKERARQDAEAAAAAELKQAEEFRARQSETGDIFGEAMRTEGPAKGKQAFGKMEGDVSPFMPSEEAQLKAGRTYDQRTVAERERAAQEQAVETQTPFEAMRQRDLLADRVDDLETRIARAAAKGDVDTVTRLTAQRAQASAALEEAIKVAKAAGPVEVRPEDQFQRLNEEYNKRIKELQKAGDLGDFARIEKLSGELKSLQEQLRSAKDVGPDLFAVEKASVEKEKDARIKDEIGRYEDEVSARGEDAARTEAQQKQRAAEEAYQAKQKELEEAFANGAEGPIINRLVAEVEASRKGMTSDRAEPISASVLEERNQNLENLRNKITEEEYAYKAKETEHRQAIEARDQAALEKQTPAQRGVLTRKVQKLFDEMGQIQENLWSLKYDFANATNAAAESRPEIRRASALDAQKEALGDLQVALQDLASTGKVLGLAPQRARGEALGAISKYVDASIKEVNAIRDANRQKPLTRTEAIQLAVDLRSWAERAVNSKSPDALKIGKGGVSPMEKQLAELKSKYHKGESKLQRGEQGLRQEFDRVTGEEGVAGAGERLRLLEEKITALKGQVNPDRNVIAQLEKAAAKERLLADRERVSGETRERQGSKSADEGVSTIRTERETRQTERQREEQALRESKEEPVQKSLFGDKELGTFRATANNFMRLLRSASVQKIRQQFKAVDGMSKEVDSILSRLEKAPPGKFKFTDSFERLKHIGEKADKLEAMLTDLLYPETKLRARIKAEEERLKSVELEAKEARSEIARLETAKEKLEKEKGAPELTDELTQKRAKDIQNINRKLEVRKEELANAEARLEKIKEQYHPAFAVDELQQKLADVKLSEAARFAEFEKLDAELGPRIKALREAKRAAEERLRTEEWNAINKKVRDAATKAEKDRLTNQANRLKQRADDQIEATKRSLKDTTADREARALEDARENLANLGGVKQEIVAGPHATPNKKETARYKKLLSQLALEKGKEKPDAKRINDIETSLAQIETSFDPKALKVIRDIEPKTESAAVEKQKETQKLAAEDLQARKARKQEGLSVSAKKTELEAAVARDARDKVRERIAKDNAHFAELQEKIDAATGKRKENLQKQLDNFTADVKKRDLVAEEKRLNDAYNKIAHQRGGMEAEAVAADQRKTTTTSAAKAAASDAKKQTAALTKQEQKFDLKTLFKEALEESGVPGAYSRQYKGRSGTDYRVEVPNTGAKLDSAVSKRTAETIEKNAPKDVKLRSVESYADLPENVKKQLVRDGITEGSPQAASVRGFVTPDGEVYIIRGNHESIKDMERTYAHELIGHAGVDRVLGPEGMQALVKRVEAQGGALELARKLGVEAQVRGALDDYALGIANMTKNKASKADIDKAMRDMETQAVRELLAYTAEKRVDETFKQKAGRWIKEVVGAIREALRKMGFAELSKVSTSDIFSILRESQRRYNKGELGTFRDVNGNMSFRTQAVFNPSIDPAEAATVGKVIAQDKSYKDKIKGNALGMSYMHRFVDRFAGLDYIARNMRDKLEGLQMMYYNRLYDQRNNMIAEIATHGSVGLEKNTDGTYQYKSRKGPSLKNVFESVSKAKSEFGNAQATLDYFGTYLAMERAASNKGGLKAGLEKLDLSGKISEAEANAILKKGRGNTSFQEARKQYRAYNDGMIDLMIESGRLSKQEGAALKQGDYVPYYRDKGGIVMDTEHNIRVGDLKTQSYLKELMGGDSAIVNFETGALQNTYMLTDMAMSNIASKNTAYTLNKLGMAEIKPGSGPAKATIIRFYENGKEMHAEINTRGNYMELEARLDKMREAGKANTPEYKKLREKAEASRASEGAFGDIPAEMIVKGMEGVASVMPAGVAMMRGPANLLRKAVTRNPAYALRVAFKDSLSGWVTSGADMAPIASTLGSLRKSLKGGDEVRALQEQGIVGGHAFAGTISDMRTIAQQIAQGQSGWEKLWAKADRMAMMADEAQRVTLYNGFIKKGMSPMEASLATLESQNFTKHGYSPTIKALSTMIPFFNAQIQGLNAFGRAITGTSLFQDKLGVREQMLKRGMMMAATTMGYSALMQNNEAYQNATEIDKLNHWFIPLPFMSEPLRVPIPFETGLVFKAIPEAIYNLMATDAKSKDVLPAIGRQVLNSVPGMSNLFLPQGVKPVVELATGTNLFTMQDIESVRQKAELPGYRAGANTTEVSKAIGKALNISPVQLDHAVNAYTSSLGIALLSMFNPMLRDAEAPDAKASQMPILGGFFQPTDGAGLIDKAYKDMDELEKINRTFKRLEESNPDEAERFLDKYIDSLDRVSAAGKFKKDMGELNKEERLIRADKEMTASQKRAELDEIKQLKIELSKEFMSISRE